MDFIRKVGDFDVETFSSQNMDMYFATYVMELFENQIYLEALHKNVTDIYNAYYTLQAPSTYSDINDVE